jgi:hypothetical protein
MPFAENAASKSVTPSLRMSSMAAEGETAMLIDPRPIRFSGFFALFLGLLSVFALFGQSLLFFVVFAVAVALFALRPYSGARPVGYLAGGAGLFCAILFGVWGVTERNLRYRFMSEHAIVFAGDWLRLMAEGDYELACELQRPPAGRQSASMPLKQYYRESEEGQLGMKNFRENMTVLELIEGGSTVKWRLNRPPTYSTQHNRHLMSTIWQDDARKVGSLIKIGLEFTPPEEGKVGQWTVYDITTWGDK